MTKTPSLVLVLAIVVGMMSSALADDQPGPDWMGKDQVTHKLSAAGYSYITGLKADDGRWEGKAVHDGRIVKFRTDPETGAVISEKPED
jgi:Peptidase propeptide and YPEB domain